MGLEEGIHTEMNRLVSLPYTGAVHDVLAKAPLPHLFALWLCIKMCRVVFQSLSRPSPLFHPQASHCVCVLVCSVCIIVASAEDFVFHYTLHEEETDNSVWAPVKCVYCMFLVKLVSVLRFLSVALWWTSNSLASPHMFIGPARVIYRRYACAQNSFA